MMKRKWIQSTSQILLGHVERSPLWMYLQFFRKGSTGEMSSLPFVAGALNCAVWAKYGVAIAQPGNGRMDESFSIESSPRT